tara:strand:- start:41 stop:571 length:531 start_codon:yes stop_codon:yes gene_type:complete
MSNQIIVPSLGESVTEATVSKWLKQVGEKVDSDEPLVELETDKVNVEVPSPQAGTLSSIRVKEGDTVEVGALLGEIDEKKSSSIEKIKVDPIEKEKELYEPAKKIKKKNIEKSTINQNKKRTSKKEEVLTLVEDHKEENKNETLVLNTLAENKIEEKKYIPPKTKQHLSPAVRKNC